MKGAAANGATRVLGCVFAHPWHVMGYAMLCAMAWHSYVFSRAEETFARSRTYDLMRDIGTEDQWALVFGIAAALRAAAFVYRDGRFIAFANLCVTFMAAIMCVCFFWSGGMSSTGAGMYAILTAVSLIVTMRRLFLNAAGQPV